MMALYIFLKSYRGGLGGGEKDGLRPGGWEPHSPFLGVSENVVHVRRNMALRYFTSYGQSF